MNQRIKPYEEHMDLLKILAQPKNKYRPVILAKADRKLVNLLCEVVYNLLKGNINIAAHEKQQLHKFKNTLRKLVEKSSLKQKRKILVQQGGFLQFLLPAIITGVSSIISSAISRNNEARD